jgi:hypothetical protein
MRRYFRCVCCGSGYYSDKPQNPAFDDGHGAGTCCQERLAKSYERFGFAKHWSMPRNESAEMFERFA